MDMDCSDGPRGATTAGNSDQATVNLCNQRGLDEKKAAVDEEMSRISKLPPNSTYAVHRLRVLNKILHLLSIQRNAAQEQELELLFSGLSI